MWYLLLFMCWVILLRFYHMYDQFLLLNYDEMVFIYLYSFHLLFIIGTNTWLWIGFFLQLIECIKGTVGFNIDTREVSIFYKNTTVWYVWIIWFATVYMWENSRTSPIHRNVQNLPSLFPSWRFKHHDYLSYFCKIVPQYNKN